MIQRAPEDAAKMLQPLSFVINCARYRAVSSIRCSEYRRDFRRLNAFSVDIFLSRFCF